MHVYSQKIQVMKLFQIIFPTIYCHWQKKKKGKKICNAEISKSRDIPYILFSSLRYSISLAYIITLISTYRNDRFPNVIIK